MLAAYRRLRNRVGSLPEAPDLGVREAFLDWLDPDLRDRLISIYETYFPFEQKPRHLKVFERSRILTERATSALRFPRVSVNGSWRPSPRRSDHLTQGNVRFKRHGFSDCRAHRYGQSLLLHQGDFTTGRGEISKPPNTHALVGWREYMPIVTSFEQPD